MLESKIEAHLVKRCKELSILCDKFISPQRRSVPDRMLSWHGRVVFVELKATGAAPTEAQQRDHIRRRAVGTEVVWTDSIGGIEVVLTALAEGVPIPFVCGRGGEMYMVRGQG